MDGRSGYFYMDPFSQPQNWMNHNTNGYYQQQPTSASTPLVQTNPLLDLTMGHMMANAHKSNQERWSEHAPPGNSLRPQNQQDIFGMTSASRPSPSTQVHQTSGMSNSLSQNAPGIFGMSSQQTTGMPPNPFSVGIQRKVDAFDQIYKTYVDEAVKLAFPNKKAVSSKQKLKAAANLAMINRNDPESFLWNSRYPPASNQPTSSLTGIVSAQSSINFGNRGSQMAYPSPPAFSMKTQSEMMRECIVCNEMCSMITFDPCYHQICCEECGRRMKKCIMCHIAINKRFVDGKILGPKETPQQQSSARERYLETKIQEFEETHCCSICLERQRNVAFLCGHSACSECAEALKICHMCRQKISKKINLY